jgi:acyl-CoA reductase-like NAD-dependent aldehyde dehydrogenase
MEMNWSRWFHCESSFGLLLVPSQPGVFALAEEVVQAAGPQSRRMLAVFEVAEAEDLSRAMSRLFAAGSPWREKLAQARCYVRYAIAPSIADRRTAATALKNWLSTQREVASQIFEKALTTAEPSVSVPAGETGEVRIERRAARMQHDGALEMKTVAERAVDRVTHGIKLGKAVSAGS